MADDPSNCTGPTDHSAIPVTPALIRKLHEAKIPNAPTVSVGGSCKPQRAFEYNEANAVASMLLMNPPSYRSRAMLGRDETRSGRLEPTLNNISSITLNLHKRDGATRKLLIGRLAALAGIC